MRRHRHILVVILVAGSLWADRAVMALPVTRAHVGEVAGQLVGRLSVNLRRVVPAARVDLVRQEGTQAEIVWPLMPKAPVVRLSLSLFELRLPPPTA